MHLDGRRRIYRLPNMLKHEFSPNVHLLARQPERQSAYRERAVKPAHAQILGRNRRHSCGYSMHCHWRVILEKPAHPPMELLPHDEHEDVHDVVRAAKIVKRARREEALRYLEDPRAGRARKGEEPSY